MLSKEATELHFVNKANKLTNHFSWYGFSACHMYNEIVLNTALVRTVWINISNT